MAGRMVLATRLLGSRVGLFRSIHHQAPDYYGILGVSKHAEIKDIKFAYYNMAKKFHPDNNQTLDARQVFSLVAEAYEVLSDQERRSKYDETGLSEQKFGGTSTGPGRQASDSSYTAEHMYQTIFGSGAKDDGFREEVHTDYASTHSGSEATREFIVQVSAEEAILGTKVIVQLCIVAVCDKCQGSRSEMGYTGNICPYCEGTGKETVRTGHITARKTCTYCNGEKIFIKFKCLECEGLGKRTYDAPYPVIIPAGTRHGEVFRLELDQEKLNVPEAGREEDFQSLYITVSVGKSESFSVDGIDLVTNLELSPAMALLGGKACVSTPGKDMTVDVESGTSSHVTFVVPDEGVRPMDCLPGDLVLKTCIRVPLVLSRKQTRIARKFAYLETKEGYEDGLIEGIDGPTDHKLRVNLVTADKVSNFVVREEVGKRMDKTIQDILKSKLGVEVEHPLGKPVKPNPIL